MITKLNAERFETKLAIQLLKLGIMIDQNFKVPGTNHYLDLYITSPIRGIVEVQYSHKIQSLNSRKLIQSMEQLSDIFGSSVSFFLVMHYKRPIEPLITVIEQFQKKIN